MSRQSALDNIKKHIALTEAECALIDQTWRLIKLSKKDYLFERGEITKDAALVLSGCLRSFSIDENGFEHIMQFAPSNWWITDMYSFISQKPGDLSVQAIMDSEVVLLSRKDQLMLFDKVPALERYFRILTENSLVAYRQRLIDNLSLSAKQRYANFCQTFPSLIHDIPQKLIAAYIGVTPEFLSKMRSEYLRNS
ncbi:Crp/Fnr family transcriptional regulator [Aquirufa rosea]|uniref:Crp/Fnr family transcriptional regulator n=1 Tax=Aquirufa rosea TaxID=2509241 RepID=A0A4Q1BYY6_9BACT|nr:Crp/Fnr family transcriptional regulator [Aquirufa rosea]RXK48299.1 Crp/Fnr family transcriptional regulator [Aquirufa rosea]